MKAIVRNTRPSPVAVAGMTFRPRSQTPVDTDELTIALISRRYGLAVERPVAPPDPLLCPDCGRDFASAFGLASHKRAKHKESEL